jgi:hypothetical protein
MANLPAIKDNEFPMAGYVAVHYVAYAVGDLVALCRSIKDPDSRDSALSTTTTRIDRLSLPREPKWGDLKLGCMVEVEVCGTSENARGAKVIPLEKSVVLPPFEVCEGRGYGPMTANASFGANGLERKYSKAFGEQPIYLSDLAGMQRMAMGMELVPPCEAYQVRVWLRIKGFAEPQGRDAFLAEYASRHFKEEAAPSVDAGYASLVSGVKSRLTPAIRREAERRQTEGIRRHTESRFRFQTGG